MSDAVRLRGRDTIEVVVSDRAVVIDGELLLDAADGASGFWMEASTRWRWADGGPMSEADRAQLVIDVPRIGREHGWSLELDEGPWPAPLPITSLFEFSGVDRLVWTSGTTSVTVPGRLTIDRGYPSFAMDLGATWTNRDGSAVSGDDVARLATAIADAAPANGVVITATGRPRGLS
jgi:hypothetical protein